MIRQRVILDTACDTFEISREVLFRSLTKDVVAYRAATAYVIRFFNETSYPVLGSVFGRDHTTIMNAVQKAERDLYTAELVEELLEAIEARTLVDRAI